MWPTVQKKKKVDATHRDTKHKLLPEKVSSSLVFKGNSLTEALLLTEKLLTRCVEKKNLIFKVVICHVGKWILRNNLIPAGG